MSTLLRVVVQYRFLTVWVLSSWLLFSAVTWVSNLSLIGWYFAQPGISLGAKLWLLISMYGSIVSSQTLLSATLLLIIVMLSGLNVALLDRYIRTRKSSAPKPTGAWSLAGMVAGFFGVGCASCGSVILASLLSLFGAGSLVFLLPFHGLEISVLAVLLLVYGTRRLIKKLNDPLVCRV